MKTSLESTATSISSAWNQMIEIRSSRNHQLLAFLHLQTSEQSSPASYGNCGKLRFARLSKKCSERSELCHFAELDIQLFIYSGYLLFVCKLLLHFHIPQQPPSTKYRNSNFWRRPSIFIRNILKHEIFYNLATFFVRNILI